jgi:predicted amidophosphoribosyltransferase
MPKGGCPRDGCRLGQLPSTREDLSVSCPNCGSENSPSRKFCGNCGAPLAITCPSCGTANEPEVRFCGEYGESIAEREHEDDAQALLAEAREIFERLEARPWLERMDRPRIGGRPFVDTPTSR